MRCNRCPVAPDLECIGERAPRFCQLIDPSHPDYDPRYRDTIPIHAKPRFPSAAQQAANLAGAVGRVVSAVVHGEPVKVSAEVYAERLAICLPCEFNGERPDGVRCTKCGCPASNPFGLGKLQLATERCPIGKWETVK